MGDMGDDFRVLKQMTDEMRDERLVRFEERVLPKLKRLYDVDTYDGGTRYVVHNTPKGTLTIYPKANNLQIHGVNTWQKPAVKWLYKNGII